MSEKEHRGYIIVAMQDFEYEQATALAYSIKIHNKDASITLVTNYIDRVPDHYHEVFDYMIELPYSSSETTNVLFLVEAQLERGVRVYYIVNVRCSTVSTAGCSLLIFCC